MDILAGINLALYIPTPSQSMMVGRVRNLVLWVLVCIYSF